MHPTTLDAPTIADVAVVSALMNRADIVEIGRPDVNEEELRASWHEPGFLLSSDAWVVREGNEIRGYAELTVRDAGRDFDGDHRVDPLHETPEHHARLIEAMLARANSLSDTDDAMLGEYAPSGATARRDALARAGFGIERVVHRMVIELLSPPPSPQWPADTEAVAMTTPQAEREVHAVIQTAFKDHYRFSPESFEDWRARHWNHPRHDSRLFRIVRRAGEPVAAIEALDVGDFGWIPRLGVVPGARRLGLGRAMLYEVFAALWAKGQRRTELGVDCENASGATQLYEQVGMRIEARYDLFRRRIRLS